MITSKQLQNVKKLAEADDVARAMEALAKLIKQVKTEEKLKRNPLLAFSDKKYPNPKTMFVEVSRVGVGNIELEITDAVSERDAAQKALDEAVGWSFSEKDADYQVESVT